MAPSLAQINNRHHPDQIPKISRVGSSKAQLCLQKILHIILTVPESSNGCTPTRNEAVPTTKVGDPPTQSPASAIDGGEVAIEEEKTIEPVANKDIDGDRRNGGSREGGGDCMGLLIQAATLIFGGIKDENHEKTARMTATSTGGDIRTAVNVKRRSNEGWPVDLYGVMEPVVRSKRGRIQVLPCKYRDSVIEPLTRVAINRPTQFPSKQRRLR